MAGNTIRINKESIANVYLFYGVEDFKKKNYKEQLKAALIRGENDMNFAIFKGKDIDLSAVYDSVVTLPFFAEKRLVIVEGCGRFKAKKKAKADADAAGKAVNSADEEDQAGDAMLEKILQDLPATTCLAFFEEEAAKNKRVYKTVASKGVVCECVSDTKEEVVLWLAKGFAHDHKKIRRSTAELIVDRVGLDYTRLRLEYEKIVSYVGESDEITDEAVLAVTDVDIESKIFDMLRDMSEKNTNGVLRRYYDLLANREAPLYILAMIRMQFRTMLQAGELAAQGIRNEESAAMMKKQPFVVERARRFLRSFGTENVEQILDEICETDCRIKSGDIDQQIGVELMLIRFSS